jgi:hypothetical protein
MSDFDVGRYLSGLIIAFAKFAYPTYISYKAIRSDKTVDDGAWLVYWTIIGFESFFESYVIPFLAWVPFFMLVRMVFYIWLQIPILNGSIFMFRQWVQPFFEQSAGVVNLVEGDESGHVAREEQKREIQKAFHRILDSLATA